MNLDHLKSIINDLAIERGVSEKAKQHLMHSLQKLNNEKINILITGATGCGKSSTINALFGDHVAKVGQGSDPETMDIRKFELNNIILWDSPGLGDNKEADRRHAKNIIEKLYATDQDGNALIDLVLVILDGGSRDLGTSYQLINEVIIPNLGKDTGRLLVAINQCDMAMKGRYWNHEKNEPEPKLIGFLNEQVESVRRRIYEGTGVKVTPIYYSAGFKDGDGEQQAYNLSKLFMHIINATKPKKRAVYINDMNKDRTVWEKDDQLFNYQQEIQKSLWSSIVDTMEKGADIGGDAGENLGRFIGSIAGEVGSNIVGGLLKGVGSIAGGAIGAVTGFIGGLFS